MPNFNCKNDIVVYGRNTVIEALKSKAHLGGLLIYRGMKQKEREEIEGLAKSRGLKITLTDRAELERISKTSKNQGVAAYLDGYRTLKLKEAISFLETAKSPKLVLVLDSIKDPQNFGSIIRTASAFGVDLIAINEDRSAPVSGTVFKVSEGGLFRVQIAKMPNLNQFMKKIKDLGFWIYGLEACAKTNLTESDLSGDVALVLGSEGEGMRDLTKKTCDFLLKIPMAKGSISSLNVSISAALGMFEVIRKRGIQKVRR